MFYGRLCVLAWNPEVKAGSTVIAKQIDTMTRKDDYPSETLVWDAKAPRPRSRPCRCSNHGRVRRCCTRCAEADAVARGAQSGDAAALHARIGRTVAAEPLFVNLIDHTAHRAGGIEDALAQD